MYYFFTFYIIFNVLQITVCGTNEKDSTKEKANCFRFTWLGPKYNNDTNIGSNTDITCTDILGTSENNPCRQPLVITYDGTIPDTDYLWKNYQDKIKCEQTAGSVCVRYSHLFNGIVQNRTYMCATAEDDSGPIEKNCYRQKLKNGREIEACFCKTFRGADMPCNSANGYKINQIVILFFIFFVSSQLFMYT